MELPTILAALAAFLPVAYGAPVEQADAVLSPSILSALERDLGLDASEATARYNFEIGASDVIKELRTALGDSFAGAWVEDGKVINVATSSEADAAEVEKAGATHKLVKNDLPKVQKAKKALDDLFKQPRTNSDSEPGIALFYVDVATTKLIIEALPESLDEAEALAKDVGLSESEFEVRKIDELLKPVELLGGGGYLINRSTRCSVGFNVGGGFVSAGHCGSPGGDVTYTDGVAVGTFERSDFPGADMAFISTLSSVAGPGYVGAYGAQSDQAVRGTSVVPVGAGICRSGSTTGWRCGEVQAYGVTVNYSQGSVFDMVRSSACAEGGDSGGSFISGDQAQGITSGASGDCTQGGTSVFQPLIPTLERYGLSLTTA